MISTRYGAEHESFRGSVRAFLQREVVPHHAQWERDGQVDRAAWIEAGKQGFLGFEGFCSGEMITAIAMSEPGAGSDLQGIRTTARRDGDDFVVSGAKTFITNGILADLVIVVARTRTEGKASDGLSLIAVERGMPGFERGRRLEKAGLHAQDTAELSFTDVRVPAANLIGDLDRGSCT